VHIKKGAQPETTAPRLAKREGPGEMEREPMTAGGDRSQKAGG